MNGLEIHESRRILDEIDRILFDVWDPIGVNDDPAWPRDEYSNYVFGVYKLLVDGVSDAAIASHLDDIAEDRIGLNRGDTRSTVVALRSISLS